MIMVIAFKGTSMLLIGWSMVVVLIWTDLLSSRGNIMITLFLASVMGWYLVIFSLYVFLKREYLRGVISDVVSQRGLFFIIAVVTLIFGLLVVVSHNYWIMGWPVIVTLMGWLMLISGLIRLFYAEFAMKMASSYMQSPMKMNIAAGIFLIIGLFLLFHVYYA